MRWAIWLLPLLLVDCSVRDRPEPVPPSIMAPPPETILEPVAVDLAVAASHPLPEGAPSVVLRVPAGLPLQGAPAVVYFHGWDGCAEAVVETGPTPCYPDGPEVNGWGLAPDPREGSWIVAVPQLAFLAQSSSAGRFSDADFARSWWTEVRSQIGAESGVELGTVVLAAHSGGYRSLEALLAADLEGVDSAVFLDGLYGGAEEVASWVGAGPGRRVVSVHTPHPGTTGQSRLLAQLASAVLGEEAVAIDPEDVELAIRSHAVVVFGTDADHGAVPDAHLDGILTALFDDRV